MNVCILLVLAIHACSIAQRTIKTSRMEIWLVTFLLIVAACNVYCSVLWSFSRFKISA